MDFSLNINNQEEFYNKIPEKFWEEYYFIFTQLLARQMDKRNLLAEIIESMQDIEEIRELMTNAIVRLALSYLIKPITKRNEFLKIRKSLNELRATYSNSIEEMPIRMGLGAIEQALYFACEFDTNWDGTTKGAKMMIDSIFEILFYKKIWPVNKVKEIQELMKKYFGKELKEI